MAVSDGVGVGVNDDVGLEREADLMGGRALQGEVGVSAEGVKNDDSSRQIGRNSNAKCNDVLLVNKSENSLTQYPILSMINNSLNQQIQKKHDVVQRISYIKSKPFIKFIPQKFRTRFRRVLDYLHLYRPVHDQAFYPLPNGKMANIGFFPKSFKP